MRCRRGSRRCYRDGASRVCVQRGLFGTPRETLTPRSPVAAVQAASGLDADCLIHRMRRCYRDGASRIWVQRGLFGTPRETLTPRSPVAAVQAASGLDADCLIHRIHRRRGSRRCYRDGACRVCVRRGLFGTPRETLTPRSPVAAAVGATSCRAGRRRSRSRRGLATGGRRQR